MVTEVGGPVKLRMLPVAGWVLVVLASTLGGYLVGGPVNSSGVSGCCREVGLLPGGLLVFADAAEHGGEVAGGEFPVEGPGGLVVALNEGQQRPAEVLQAGEVVG